MTIDPSIAWREAAPGKSRNERKRFAKLVKLETRAPRLHERLTEASEAQLRKLRPHATSRPDNFIVLAAFCLLLGLPVYGGALRDSIAGTEINNVDTMVPCAAEAFVEYVLWLEHRFRWMATCADFAFESRSFGPPLGENEPITTATMYFAYGEMKLKVDFTAASVLETVDLDVNGLWIQPAGRGGRKLEVRNCVGLSLEELVAKCAARKFSTVKHVCRPTVWEDNTAMRAATQLLGRNQGWVWE